MKAWVSLPLSFTNNPSKSHNLAAALIVLWTGAVLPAFSQPGAQVWVNRFNEPLLWPPGVFNIANATAIAVDHNGNAFVAGSVGYQDNYFTTLAYSAAGVPIWTNYPGSPTGGGWGGSCLPSAIALDNNGNVYVTGSYHGPVGPYCCVDNFYTVAYSSTGTMRWSDSYDVSGLGRNIATAVAVGNGSVVVTGYATNKFANLDYATVAYSSSGTLLWVSSYNGPNNGPDCPRAIKIGGNGNVYVTGYSDGGTTTNDYATVAYSSTGVALWTNRYGGLAWGDDRAVAMAIDGGGNVYVTGYSQGIGSGYDYVTIAYSAAGVPLWTNRYNGPANKNDYASAIAVDAGGNVAVTGYSNGGTSTNDFATIAYSNTGVPLWTNRYGLSGDDRPVAVAIDDSGNVFVTGYSTGYDYATVAYSRDGAPLWVQRYNGPGNGSDFATGLALDPAGNVLVTGYSRPSGGGFSDYLTIKYASSIQACLSAQVMGGQLRLTWTNAGFKLQSAPMITGPFTNITPAASPFTVPTAEAAEFFRLTAN